MAGEKDVSIASPSIAQQALNAGLLEVITVAPFLLGAGSRVTHLRYRLQR